MGEFPASRTLLERVIQRLYLARIGRGFFWSVAGFAALYGLLLLLSRLTGLIPDWYTPSSIALIPLGALAVSLLWIRRPTAADAARQVDRHERTQDLYLTLTMLEGAAGEYKPLVGRDAEARAGRIQPAGIVPWPWQRPLLQIAACLLLLAVGTFVLPSLDPFGKVAEAKEAVIRHEELRKSQKATEVRKSQLSRSDSDAQTSEEVRKNLEELQADLRRMEPKQREDNARTLASHQKKLGESWRLNADQLKQLLNKVPLKQRFGDTSQTGQEKWLKQLQEGRSEALQEELDELQQDLQEALSQSDPVKRTEAMRRLQKKLDEMRDFARDEANSRPLAAALERAMKQLEAMKSSEMSQEASEAAAQSLKLASMELKQLAQSMRDLKELEKALEAVQLAKKLNSDEQLSGEACENCQSMADYAELYAEMMAQLGYDVAMGEGEGEGTGGEGIGEGGEVPEDESARTDFQDETAESTVQRGKILLSIKTKGVSENEDEDLQLEYRTVVKELKQSVSEAIDQEQIPPGYHEGIKKYFDSLDETPAP